jgi:hypothetical protein
MHEGLRWLILAVLVYWLVFVAVYQVAVKRRDGTPQ